MAITTYDTQYYDDYHSPDLNGLTPEDKNYLRMMFRPGRSIQARELNQMQSILQTQIDYIGRGLFKNNAPVVGGETSFDTDIFYIDVYIENITDDNQLEIMSGWVNNQVKLKIQQNDKTIYGTSVYSVEVGDVPGDNTVTQFRLYFEYRSDDTSTGSNQGEFSTAATIIISDPRPATQSNTPGFGIQSSIVGQGNAVSVNVEPGIFYINGTFIPITKQYIAVPLEAEETQFTGKAFLQIKEELITSLDDGTLLDNADGHFNYNAPGADRYKATLQLSLHSISEISAIELANPNYFQNHVTLLYIVDDQITNRTASIENKIRDTLAQRTFEESGDYWLKPFNVEVNNVYNETVGGVNNKGIYNNRQDLEDALTPYLGAERVAGFVQESDIISESRNWFACTISPSVAYVKGHRVELEQSLTILGRRARDKYSDVYLNGSFRSIGMHADIGNHVAGRLQYGLPVFDIAGKPYNIYKTETSSYFGPSTFDPVTGIGSTDIVEHIIETNVLIGTCKFQTIESWGGKDCQLYLYDIVMNEGYNFNADADWIGFDHSSGVATASYSGYGPMRFNIAKDATTTTNLLKDTQRVSSLFPFTVYNIFNIDNGSINVNLRRSVLVNAGVQANNYEAQISENSNGATIDGSKENFTIGFNPNVSTTGSAASDSVFTILERDDYEVQSTGVNEISLTPSLVEKEYPAWLYDSFDSKWVRAEADYTYTSLPYEEDVNIGQWKTGQTVAYTDPDTGQEMPAIENFVVGQIVFISEPHDYRVFDGGNSYTTTPISGPAAYIATSDGGTGTIWQPYQTHDGEEFTGLVKEYNDPTKTDTFYGKLWMTETRRAWRDGWYLRVIYTTNVNLSAYGILGTKTYTEAEYGSVRDITDGTYVNINQCEPGKVYELIQTGNTNPIYHLNSLQLSQTDIAGGLYSNSYFSIDSDGQHKTYYAPARIKCKATPPTGLLKLRYWAVSEQLAGDERIQYFTPQSYQIPDPNNSIDLVSAAEFYRERIPSYEGISLADVLDLRPPINNRIEAFDDASSTHDQNSTRISLDPLSAITLDVDYYLPRKDLLVATSDKFFRFIEGKPAVKPEYPPVPAQAMVLYSISLPAYTGVLQSMIFDRIESRRYSMKDIGSLENRIESLEYYTSLNILEKSAQDESIYDEAGERFKNGFVVDGFRQHDVGDKLNFDYKCSIDGLRGILFPEHVGTNIGCRISDFGAMAPGNPTLAEPYTYVLQDFTTAPTVNGQVQYGESVVNPRPRQPAGIDTTLEPRNAIFPNGLTQPTQYDIDRQVEIWPGININTLTLPYSEKLYIHQPFATKFIPVQPHEVVVRRGTLELFPSVDTWVETRANPALNIGDPYAGLQDFVIELAERTVGGDSWNEWFTTTSSRTETTVSSSGSVFPQMNWQRFGGGTRTGGRGGRGWTGDDIAERWPGFTWVGGRTWGIEMIAEWTVETTVQEFEQTFRSREGTNTQIGAGERIDQSLGRYVSEVKHNPYMRTKLIAFFASGLKPNTAFYPFFEDVDVSDNVYNCTNTAPGDFLPGEEEYTTWNEEFAERAALTIDPSTGETLANVWAPGPYEAWEWWKNISDTNNQFDNMDETTLKQIADATFGGAATENGYQNRGAGSLVTNERGQVWGFFILPGPFRQGFGEEEVAGSRSFSSGEKVFKLTNSPRNRRTEERSAASARYISNGLQTVTDERILSTTPPVFIDTAIREDEFVSEELVDEWTDTDRRGIVWFYDPVAQSFNIDDSTGIFVSSVDVYFANKSEIGVPVEVYLVPTTAGQPTTTIIPGSKVIKDPDAVHVSDDSSVPTTFTFQDPIYLKPRTEYALVVFSPSTEYDVWISELDENDILTDTTVDQQPVTGVFFTSANKSTWTAYQNRDLKFKLWRADFKYAGYYNKDQGEYDYSSKIVKAQPNIGKFIDGVNIINNGSHYTTLTTVEFASPNTVGGIRATGVPEIDPITGAITNIIITQKGFGYTSDYITVTVNRNLAEGVEPPEGAVEASIVGRLPRYDVSLFNLNLETLLVNDLVTVNTSVNMGSNDIGGSILYDDVVPFEPVENILSETHFISDSSAGNTKINMEMKTTDTRVTPIVDMKTIGLALRKYNITADEISTSRYITRKVVLDEPANQLDGYLSINRPNEGANVTIFAKLWDIDDQEIVSYRESTDPNDPTIYEDLDEFDVAGFPKTNNWWRIPLLNPSKIPTSNNKTYFSDCRFQRSWDGLTRFGADPNAFNSQFEFVAFKIRINLLNDDIVNIPTVKDMRFIASS